MTKSIFQAYQRQILELGVRYSKFYKAYDKVKKWLHLPDGQQQYIDRRRSWMERLAQPEFPVAFLGSFSTGKSSIINAIIGKEILPENMKVFTAIPTLIRKGAENQAVVCYLSAREKVELFNLWVHEIEQKLKRALPHCSQEDNPESKILEITAMINAVGDPELNFNTELQRLSLLAEKWNSALDKLPINIEELSNYATEDYPDVSLVSRVEVTVKDINLEEGVVLVDLPGLNVVNPLHRKITKDYVEREAKAFVICMKPDGLLEGDEILLLEEVYRQNPRILQRAFWVFNKWDAINQQQSRETEQAFEEKMAAYGFSIAQERKFQVSALNYLLLKYILNGDLKNTRKLKEHIDNLSKYGTPYRQINAEKAAGMLAEIPELANFEQFNEELIEYLKHDARLEFIQDAKGELNNLLSIIYPPIEQMRVLANQGGRTKEELIISLASKELDALSAKLKETIESAVAEIRIDDKLTQNCWPALVQQETANVIIAKIKGLDKRAIKNEVRKGADVDYNDKRLYVEIEKQLDLSGILRTKLKQQISQILIGKFSTPLMTALTQVAPIPAILNQELKALLDEGIIHSRIDGLADALLYGYGDHKSKINLDEKAGSTQQPVKTNIDGKIEHGISIFQQAYVAFVKSLPEEVNEKAGRLIKNFAENIEVKATMLIDINKSSFTPLVIERANLNEELYQEEIKRGIIQEVAEIMHFLTTGIQNFVDDTPE